MDPEVRQNGPGACPKCGMATSSAIRNLLGLAPKTARCIETDGSDRAVPLSEVHVGDRLRVRPGERVPVDGVILEGRTTIDESMVSGEPIPVEKAPDAQVTGGTVNGTGTPESRSFEATCGASCEPAV